MDLTGLLVCTAWFVALIATLGWLSYGLNVPPQDDDPDEQEELHG